jgi:hypothetical protein
MIFNGADFDRAVQVAAQIESETGYLPALDDNRLQVSTFTWPFENEPHRLLREFPVSAMQAGPARAVLAAAIYSFTERDAAEAEGLLRDHLRRVSANEVSGLRRLRWELHAATTARDLKRVLEVGRVIEQASDGAQNFGAIARAAFRCIQPAKIDLVPSALDPEIHSKEFSFYSVSELILFMMATIVEGRRSLDWWIEPSEFSPEILSAILATRSLIDRAEQLGTTIEPSLAAIRC